jgi:hypothetical protein
MFFHTLKNLLHSFSVGLLIWEEDKEVIHVDNQPSFGDEILQGVIHEMLKCGRSVHEAKEHNSWFKESSRSNKGGFPLITFIYPYIVVSPSDVEFGEDLSAREFINEIGDKQKRIRISDNVFIKVTVVLTGLSF